MKLKAAIFTLAAIALTVNTIGCAGGDSSRKNRISNGVVDKVGDTDNSGEESDTDTIGDKSNTTDETSGQDSKTETKSQYDEKIAGEIQDSLDEITQGDVLTKAQLANKTLNLKSVTLKYSSSAATQKQDSFAAITTYDVSGDKLTTSATLKSSVTGVSTGLNSFSLPMHTKMVFGDGAKADAASNSNLLTLNVELSEKGIAAKAGDADKNFVIDDLLTIITQLGTEGANGLMSFDSAGKSGNLRILSHEKVITMVVEIEVDDSTRQVFAISYDDVTAVKAAE